jgi:hypothetical protein
MTIGAFMKFLAMLGYPAQGSALAGGGIAGLKSVGALDLSPTQRSVTATTAETTLVTIAIPANALVVPGSRFRVAFDFTCTSNANTKMLRMRLAGTQLSAVSSVLASIAGGRWYFDFVATASGAQKSLSGMTSPWGSNAAAAMVTSAIDMTQQQNVTLTMQLGTSTDNFQIEDYVAEILNR